VLPARCDGAGFDGRSLRFLNRRLLFEGDERWCPPGMDRLWVYHLHYFQYLHAMPVAEGVRFVSDWIEVNRDPRGPGWEPYPLSLRIREWTEFVLSHPGLPPEFREKVIASLTVQAEALLSQIEYHLLGNHLLENAITLCWAGLSLEAPTSGAWARKGLALLSQQLRIQILPDGSHDERSPMYQALLAEALLRLAEVAQRSPAPIGEEIGVLARRNGLAMLAALEKLSHPDGEVALLNDCSLGEAPTAGALRARFGAGDEEPAREGVWSLRAAGYMGWRNGDGYAVFDAGAMGPDYQPGHGHADTLGLELSQRGRRLLTDTGTYTYEPGAERSYDRGTAAHNTIQLDGRDQAELWSAFRCGRRPKLREAGSESEDGNALLHGAYSAPAGGFSAMAHSRRVSFEGGVLHVRDEVKASGKHRADLKLHVAPGLSIAKGHGGLELVEGGRVLARVTGDGFIWSEGRSPYHPEFGLEIERPCLSASLAFKDNLAVEWQVALD
jgi:hypothetical protein